MIPAHDILGRQSEIKNYIAAGDMEQTVKRFIDFAQEFNHAYLNDAILYSKRFQDLKRKENLGLISFDDKTLEDNKLAAALLARGRPNAVYARRQTGKPGRDSRPG